eukprot:COSAG06_NODE_7048_length_2658_cov_1.549043_3_plen_67_part_00
MLARTPGVHTNACTKLATSVTHSLSNVLLKNYELAANRVAAAAAAAAAAEEEDATDTAALADNQNQ